jgi:hypothetical protein
MMQMSVVRRAHDTKTLGQEKGNRFFANKVNVPIRVNGACAQSRSTVICAVKHSKESAISIILVWVSRGEK